MSWLYTNKSWKKEISLFLSILLTVVLLIVLLLNISLEKILKAFVQVPLAYILLGSFFHFIAYFFRTQTLFCFLKKEKVSFVYLLAIHFIHNFYVHIVPASLGELSFPLLLKDKVKVEKSLSVLVISRLILMALTAILFLISIFYILDISKYIQFNIKYIFLIALGLMFLFLLWKLKKRLINILQKNKFFTKIIAKIRMVLESTKEEITKMRNFKFSLNLFLNSLINIAATIGFYVVILKGEGIELHVFEVVFISSIGVAFMVLPIKSIGGFGTTEGSWTIGLMVLGIGKEKAIESGFVIHILALINVAVLCLIGVVLKRKFSGISKISEKST